MSGRLVIISAPSGAGKTTIVRHLLNCNLGLEFSVSATTRQKRDNETDGRDYYFMSVEKFREMIGKDGFVEWQEVYTDNFYGTPRSEIERILSKGGNVLFDVDVMGGINLKNIFGSGAVSIFIMPPSIEELGKRLTARGTDLPEKIRMRVIKAGEEIRHAGQFDFIVINDDLEKAKEESFRIVSDFIRGQVQ
ncbi:MAG TPA: guanylate kinase [Bacteroidales bacterium]|nr:guanylate kinase [Bacteroidales bacterium]